MNGIELDDVLAVVRWPATDGLRLLGAGRCTRPAHRQMRPFPNE
jgi:hypothetical protein